MWDGDEAEGRGRRRRRSLAGCVLGLALAAALPAAAAQDCGPVTQSEVMTAERLACWDGRVVGSDLILDLDGATIGRLFLEGDRITVRNGTVDGRGVGLDLVYAAFTTDVVLERLTIKNSGGTWAVVSGTRTTVRNSRLTDNAGAAIEQYWGSGLRVVDSELARNGRGVTIQKGDGAVIENNRFRDNALAVQIWDEDWIGASRTRIEGNTFDHNAVGVRVRAFENGSGTVIASNVFQQTGASAIAITSGHGFETDDGGARGTVIRDNVINDSGRNPVLFEACDGWETCVGQQGTHGITVIATNPDVPPTIRVANNRVIRAAGHGIYAPGVEDGGRNVASVAGARPSCVGVACRGS